MRIWSFFLCVLGRERGRGGAVHDRGAGLAGCKCVKILVRHEFRRI